MYIHGQIWLGCVLVSGLLSRPVDELVDTWLFGQIVGGDSLSTSAMQRHV